MFFDALEGPAVNLTTAIPADGLSVLPGRVALVTGKIIQGVDTVIFQHQPIPRDLGYDGGCSDRMAASVTLFNGPLGDIEGKGRDAVNQEEFGSGMQAQDRILHGLDGSPQDVMLFDFPRSHNPHPPGEGASGDEVI
jgi:hypothetical protein